MKKIILFAAMLLAPALFMPNLAQAAPSFSGTVNLNFSTGGSTTMDWSVYAATDTGSLSGSTTQYTYQYTLHGWSGFSAANGGTGQFFSDIGMAAGSATSVGFATAGGTSATVSNFASSYSDFYQGASLFFDTHTVNGGIDFTSPTATTTGWYTSSLGPVNTWIAGNLAGVSVPGATPPTYKAGAGIDSQIIMGAGNSTINAVPLAPGVPEPQTWALLLAMMGFATWWLRRRQDNEPLQTSFAA